MVQSIKSGANSFTLGTGSSRVILGANSGGLTIKDPSSNTVNLVPGTAVGVSGGATVYNTTSDLPLVDLTAGDFALVGNSSVNTNALYITNGGGWYKVNIFNLNPVVTPSQTTVTLSSANANTDIAVTITEPEGTPITNITVSNTGIANGSVANGTFHSSNNTFIIKGGSISLSGATFTISASDGINIGAGTITLNISIADWTQSSSDLHMWSLMDGETGNPAVRTAKMDPTGNFIIMNGESNSRHYFYTKNANNDFIETQNYLVYANNIASDYPAQEQKTMNYFIYYYDMCSFDQAGRTFVVGSRDRTINYSGVGGVFIFERNTSNNHWTHLHNIYGGDQKNVGTTGYDDGTLRYFPDSIAANSSTGTAVGTSEREMFGASVALSGDGKWLLAGAPELQGSIGAGGNPGAGGYVYNRSDYGNKFTFHHQLKVNIAQADTGGTKGGPYADGANNFLNTTIGGDQSAGTSGFSVGLSYYGDWAVIGVPSMNDNGACGGAFIAFRNGNQANWYRHQVLHHNNLPTARTITVDTQGGPTAADTLYANRVKDAGSAFGHCVVFNQSSDTSVDATTLAISDPYMRYYVNVGSGNRAITGVVHIYSREPSGNTWTLQQTLYNEKLDNLANGVFGGTSTQPYEGFGTKVRLSENGSRIFISVPGLENAGDQSPVRGCMHVFDRDSSNVWSFTANVAIANVTYNAHFTHGMTINKEGTRALLVSNPSSADESYVVLDAG